MKNLRSLFNMKLNRANLDVILLGLSLYAFYGCVGMGPFPVGYRTGSDIEQPVVLSVRHAENQKKEQRLLVQQIIKRANLFLTPEGPRDNYPIGYQFRYFIQNGNGKPIEMKFLRSNTDLISDAISHAYPIDNSDLWVAIQHFDSVYREEIIPGRPHNFPIYQYTVFVFSYEKIYRQYNIEASGSAASFTLVPHSYLMKFWRNDGWWLLDLMTGEEQPDPNRIPEEAPSNLGILIPGTSLKIKFDLPEFDSWEESLHTDYYTFKAEATSDIDTKQEIPKGNLLLNLNYGRCWHGRTGFLRTRDQLLNYHFNDPQPNLYKTEMFYRVDKIIKENSECGWPERKVVFYISDSGEWPIEIIFTLTAPFEQWEKVLSYFESTFHMEFREQIPRTQ
ncbi:MAG: hypothetical protein AB7S75_06670 [Desulfococcaceae bacterium]